MAVSYKNRIRSLRKKLKMTQEQMAEQLFIDQTTLSMYECGNRDIPVSILMELSTTYGDRKSTRLNSSHKTESRMPSSA